MAAGGDFGLCASAAAHAARVSREFALKKYERQRKREEKKKKIKEHPQSEFIDNLERLPFQKLKDSDIDCIECHRPYKIVKTESEEFLYCKMCKGHLVFLDSIKDMTKPHKNFQEIQFKSRRSKYTCTQCKTPLREYQYSRGFNLMIDHCEKCNYIYLENGEFKRLILDLK